MKTILVILSMFAGNWSQAGEFSVRLRSTNPKVTSVSSATLSEAVRRGIDSRRDFDLLAEHNLDQVLAEMRNNIRRIQSLIDIEAQNRKRTRALGVSFMEKSLDRELRYAEWELKTLGFLMLKVSQRLPLTKAPTKGDILAEIQNYLKKGVPQDRIAVLVSIQDRMRTPPSSTVAKAGPSKIRVPTPFTESQE